MKRLSLVGLARVAMAGNASAETVILKCDNGEPPTEFHKTYEWDREKGTGIEVETRAYMAFREQPASVVIEYLSGPQVGVSFRLDRTSMKLYVNGNNSGYVVAACAKAEPKI